MCPRSCRSVRLGRGYHLRLRSMGRRAMGFDRDSVPNSSDAANRVSIKTHGLTSLDKSFQVMVLAISPFAIILATVLSGPAYPSEFIPRLIVVIVLLICTDLGVEAILSVRRVDIDSTGVTFRYLFNTEHGSWSDISPGEKPPWRETWYVRRRRSRGRIIGRAPFRAHNITLEQAHAILAYPSRPAWNVDPTILRRLAESGSLAA